MDARRSTLDVRRGESSSLDPATAARELYHAIGRSDAALTVFFCSPDHDTPALARSLRAVFGAIPLIGCTTAGEIGTQGYAKSSTCGVSIGSDGFAAQTVRIDGLSGFELSRGEAAAALAVSRLREHTPGFTAEACFGFLIADGSSLQEEALVSALSTGLAPIPLVGGSAGDGTRFRRALVYHDGSSRRSRPAIPPPRPASPTS